ncbi:hypothetical protein [Rubrimonas cliftonensis]|uniref:Uncharacterized protein n=1 Tax=Rubrimonas cliftonensis TaxID=89524 RepID=A0A1H4ES07_9RHOB|nr:hypothetical protein [Rubrimonas cliftonensis]SEA87874.1 hypothetical protein SAMN05444370_11575 [Rubrimonas cliftonensis]
MTPIITILDDEIVIAPLGDDEDLPPLDDDVAEDDRAAALVALGRLHIDFAELPF